MVPLDGAPVPRVVGAGGGGGGGNSSIPARPGGMGGSAGQVAADGADGIPVGFNGGEGGKGGRLPGANGGDSEWNKRVSIHLGWRWRWRRGLSARRRRRQGGDPVPRRRWRWRRCWEVVRRDRPAADDDHGLHGRRRPRDLHLHRTGIGIPDLPVHGLSQSPTSSTQGATSLDVVASGGQGGPLSKFNATNVAGGRGDVHRVLRGLPRRDTANRRRVRRRCRGNQRLVRRRWRPRRFRADQRRYRRPRRGRLYRSPLWGWWVRWRRSQRHHLPVPA